MDREKTKLCVFINIALCLSFMCFDFSTHERVSLSIFLSRLDEAMKVREAASIRTFV